MLSDIEIAQKNVMEPISKIADKVGILPEELEQYGHYKAKISLDVLKRLENKPNGKLVLVTAITPTPAGEGKTTTTVGLADGLRRIGRNAVVALREPSLVINMGTTTINKQIKEKGTVDLDNDEVKSLLSYIPKWAASTIDVAEGAGTLSKDIKIESKTYSWYYFCNNRCLTNITDPWYLTAGADESAKESESYIDSKDWDIYPFPSTDYCGNTIKVVMDPICIHNYAADDGNKEWSDDEKAKLKATYTFATYWTASTEAKQAIFDQKWTDNGAEKSAAGDSFPVVTGDTYNKQMDIWNNLPAHKTYKDKEGWKEILKLWENNESWDYIDKCWTSKITEKGETTDVLYEWNNMWKEEVAGAWMTDKDWGDKVKARLSDWNTTINKRIETATKQLQDKLVENYNFDKSKFTSDNK